MNRLSKFSFAVSVLAISLSFCSSASAQSTYDLAAFPFSYMGAHLATAKLTTNVSGSFSDELAIENIFNSASYEATLAGPSGVLTQLDNTNSAWDFMFSGAAVAALTIDPAQMTLSFATPVEYTGAALLLQSTDLRSVLQYRQENNVSDYSFAQFGFNAVSTASWSTDYGTTFIFPAISPIPEPSEAALLSIGLLATLLRYYSRRRVIATTARS